MFQEQYSLKLILDFHILHELLTVPVKNETFLVEVIDLVFIERSYVGDIFSKSSLYMVCLFSVHINRDQLYFETAGKDNSFSL